MHHTPPQVSRRRPSTREKVLLPFGPKLNRALIVMIALAVLWMVSGCSRPAPKFPDGDDQCFVQHTPFIQVSDQGRESAVKHRSRLVLHSLGQTGMVVPRMVV